MSTSLPLRPATQYEIDCDLIGETCPCCYDLREDRYEDCAMQRCFCGEVWVIDWDAVEASRSALSSGDEDEYCIFDQYDLCNRYTIAA